MTDNKHDLGSAIVGIGAPVTGVTISLSEVEQWLRIISLIVGILVGLAVLANQLHKKRKRKRDRQKPMGIEFDDQP